MNSRTSKGKEKEGKTATIRKSCEAGDEKKAGFFAKKRGSKLTPHTQDGQQPSESDPQDVPTTETESHQEAKVIGRECGYAHKVWSTINHRGIPHLTKHQYNVILFSSN